MEKRTKSVYVPFGGKSMITFMDDLNMPAKDTFGSQPPLELIRLWIDYGFWYDRTKQTIKHIRVSIPRICSQASSPIPLRTWTHSQNPIFFLTEEHPVSSSGPRHLASKLSTPITNSFPWPSPTLVTKGFHPPTAFHFQAFHTTLAYQPVLPRTASEPRS